MRTNQTIVKQQYKQVRSTMNYNSNNKVEIVVTVKSNNTVVDVEHILNQISSLNINSFEKEVEE